MFAKMTKLGLDVGAGISRLNQHPRLIVGSDPRSLAVGESKCNAKASCNVSSKHRRGWALLDRNGQFVEFANSLVLYPRIGQFRRNGHLGAKLANSTIFHETSNNYLGVLVF